MTSLLQTRFDEALEPGGPIPEYARMFLLETAPQNEAPDRRAQIDSLASTLRKDATQSEWLPALKQIGELVRSEPLIADKMLSAQLYQALCASKSDEFRVEALELFGFMASECSQVVDADFVGRMASVVSRTPNGSAGRAAENTFVIVRERYFALIEDKLAKATTSESSPDSVVVRMSALGTYFKYLRGGAEPGDAIIADHVEELASKQEPRANRFVFRQIVHDIVRKHPGARTPKLFERIAMNAATDEASEVRDKAYETAAFLLDTEDGMASRALLQELKKVEDASQVPSIKASAAKVHALIIRKERERHREPTRTEKLTQRVRGLLRKAVP
jgi:hypothetical protein